MDRIALAAAEWNRARESLLAEFPELADDAEALADTLDGEVQALGVVARLIRDAREDDAMADALTPMQRDMAERKSRLSSRADKRRDIALKLMNAIGERKIVRPDFTASVRAVPPKVIVMDDAALPDDVCKFERKPDRGAIKEALERGEAVAGAVLGNGSETLTIRTK